MISMSYSGETMKPFHYSAIEKMLLHELLIVKFRLKLKKSRENH